MMVYVRKDWRWRRAGRSKSQIDAWVMRQMSCVWSRSDLKGESRLELDRRQQVARSDGCLGRKIRGRVEDTATRVSASLYPQRRVEVPGVIAGIFGGSKESGEGTWTIAGVMKL